MDGKKLIAAVVVALFCVTAYAYVDAGSASDAASKTYEGYVEVVNADGKVTNAVYVYFDSDADNAKFVEAANKAFADAGLSKLVMTYEDGSITISYDGSGNNACYYSDGNSWVSIQDTGKEYIDNSKFGLAVGNGYIPEETYEAMSLLEQANWTYVGWGYGYDYMKLLEVAGTYGKIVDYKINVTMIDNDLVKTTSDVIKFKCENEASAWCYALNKAVQGNSIFSKIEASYVEAYKYISIEFDGEINNASYVKTDGKWVAVDDTLKSYLSGSDLDFELKNGYISTEQYNSLSSSEQKNWQETGMAGGYEYMRNPGASSGDNTMLYIIIAVVVIVVIAAAAFFFMKKKNA